MHAICSWSQWCTWCIIISIFKWGDSEQWSDFPIFTDLVVNMLGCKPILGPPNQRPRPCACVMLSLTPVFLCISIFVFSLWCPFGCLFPPVIFSDFHFSYPSLPSSDLRFPHNPYKNKKQPRSQTWWGLRSACRKTRQLCHSRTKSSRAPHHRTERGKHGQEQPLSHAAFFSISLLPLRWSSAPMFSWSPCSSKRMEAVWTLWRGGAEQQFWQLKKRSPMWFPSPRESCVFRRGKPGCCISEPLKWQSKRGSASFSSPQCWPTDVNWAEKGRHLLATLKFVTNTGSSGHESHLNLQL